MVLEKIGQNHEGESHLDHPEAKEPDREFPFLGEEPVEGSEFRVQGLGPSV